MKQAADQPKNAINRYLLYIFRFPFSITSKIHPNTRSSAPRNTYQVSIKVTSHEINQPLDSDINRNACMRRQTISVHASSSCKLSGLEHWAGLLVGVGCLLCREPSFDFLRGCFFLSVFRIASLLSSWIRE